MSIRSSRRLSTISTDSTRLFSAIQEFRFRFAREGLRRCSALDGHRIMQEEWWISTFLLCYDCDVDVVMAVVAECIRWRNSFKVEQIGMLSVKTQLDRRLMYIHGYDVERSSILWIQMGQHQNGDKESERCFIFWLERHFNESRGGPLCICINMSHTTLQNMDFNLFKFMLHALKFYYPNCAQDLIVYESPILMNASWKVIRSWLDVGHPQLQLVTRDSIRQFIPAASLPITMGGEDSFEFTMDELARCIPSRSALLLENGTNGPHEADENVRPDLDNFPVKRSVKFESEDEDASRRTPLVVGQPTVRRPSRGPSGRRSSMPATMRPLADKRVHAPQEEWASNSFLAVCPRDELCLTRLEDGEMDLIDIVAVRNNAAIPLMFKIKTTSPEKFRVRPSAGIVAPGATETVRVYLQSEYRLTASKEKFLLMALQTDSTNVEEFADIWRCSPTEKKAEQKLRCRVIDDNGLDGGILSRRASSSTTSVSPAHLHDPLREEVAQLAAQQKLLGLFVVFLVVLQFVCMINERSNSASLRLAIEALTAERRNQGEGI